MFHFHYLTQIVQIKFQSAIDSVKWNCIRIYTIYLYFHILQKANWMVSNLIRFDWRQYHSNPKSIYIECLIKWLNIYAIVRDLNSSFPLYYLFIFVFPSLLNVQHPDPPEYFILWKCTWNDSHPIWNIIDPNPLLFLATSTASTLKHILYLKHLSVCGEQKWNETKKWPKTFGHCRNTVHLCSSQRYHENDEEKEGENELVEKKSVICGLFVKPIKIQMKTDNKTIHTQILKNIGTNFKYYIK